MALIESALQIGEQIAWPDALTRAAIGALVSRTARRLQDAGGAQADRAFAEAMSAYPIAIHTQDANAQHYEIPADFFALVLGPQRKYSCCLYDEGAGSLAEAEERALRATAEHAALADGQRILELGCGWGSLSLWMARAYPNADIVAVSNSASQREFIMAQADLQKLRNLQVVTADMNTFAPPGRFDRGVSVEMFEHMANWRPLLTRVRDSLDRDGRLFVHVFAHRSGCYRFDPADRSDWIAQHFFTGGIMPSHGLMQQFPESFTVEQEWRWNGSNYQRTAEAWLANFDARIEEIDRVLAQVYGSDSALWRRRWRLFFLATSGLFGHAGGNEWGVSHYRLAPA